MTLLRACSPLLPSRIPESIYLPDRNSWIILDKAWATRLGVTRVGGVYRIRRLDLFRRLSELNRLLPPTGEWTIDPANTSVGFVARHMMISKVRGRFKQVAGTIKVAQVPEDSHADIIIEAASIDTGLAMRDDHLRSPDFLDVANHPELRFGSTRIEHSGDNIYKLTGDLTIRGVTRPVTLDLNFLGAVQDPSGGCKVGFEAKAEINREDFGLTWNQALETGGVLVGREVVLEIEALAVVGQIAPAA